MTKNLKLILGVLGLTTTSGTIIATNLTYNTNSLKPGGKIATSPRGGRESPIYSKKFKSHSNLFDLKIDSGSPSKNISISPSTSFSVPEVALVFEDSKLEIPKTQLFSEETKDAPLKKIHITFEELIKEGRLSSLSKRIENQYETLREKYLSKNTPLANQLKDFNDVKLLIRNKSSGSPTASLTQQQRIILQNFYMLNVSLKSKSDHFKNNLKWIDPETTPREFATITPALKQYRKIINSLSKIAWNGKQIRVIGNSRHGGKGGWGIWAQNPFQEFYEGQNQYEEDVILSIKNILQMAPQTYIAVTGLLKEGVYDSNNPNIWNPDVQRKLYLLNDFAPGANSHVEHKIAKKLLDLMGQ